MLPRVGGCRVTIGKYTLRDLSFVRFLFEANIVANSGDNWTSNAVSLEISPLSSEIYNRSILLGVYT